MEEAAWRRLIGPAAGYGVRVTGEQAQATVFERGSNVHEYWLAHAEGFHVVSRRKPRDRVDHVVVDRQLGSATALVVRRKRGRRPKRIPVMWVSAVDPFERVVYLAPKRRAHAAAERVRPHVVDAARTARSAQHTAVEWARPRAHAAVRAALLECVRAAVWLRPRLFEAVRRVTVASVRGCRASRAFSIDAARATNRRSLAAYAWLRPRIVTAAHRAARAGRSAPNGIRTRATALKGPRPGPLVDGGEKPSQVTGR
jgi:hypothetical protein